MPLVVSASSNWTKVTFRYLYSAASQVTKGPGSKKDLEGRGRDTDAAVRSSSQSTLGASAGSAVCGQAWLPVASAVPFAS